MFTDELIKEFMEEILPKEVLEKAMNFGEGSWKSQKKKQKV